jgi:DNA-binding NarL/FixJ family response regulator
VQWIRANDFCTAILVLTAYDHNGCLATMIDAGVVGYLTKHEVSYSLAHAIRAVHGGQCVITCEQWARIENWRAAIGKRLDSLTKRERQVLHQIAQGHDNRTIASNLDISHRTVEYHITHLLGKLGLNSRLEAATWLRRHEPPVPLK